MPVSLDTMIEAIDLNKEYRRAGAIIRALVDVSLTIKSGDFVIIQGPTGCGKSTLLKIIAGIYRPTSGSLLVNSKVVPVLQWGVAFQDDFSARENIYIYGAFMGILDYEIKQNFSDIIIYI